MIARWLALVVTGLLLAGCATQPAVHGTTVGSERRVDIEHQQDGSFAVSVTLPAALDEWVFDRTPAIDMRERWTWLNPGAQLEKRGKRDVVALPNATTTLRFVVQPDDRFIQADYSLTQTFLSDGGVVLYTGHFAADEAVECETAQQHKAPCARQRPSRTRLVPRDDDWLWFASRHAASPIEWLDEHMQGSMAYFGHERPVEDAGVQMLLDPNLPVWMRDDLLRFMPELIAIYQREFGQPLSFTPRLLFSFGGGDSRRTSLYGGVVDRMVQLSVLGDIWLEPSREARQRYLYLLAHEAAHLWNGAEFNHDHSKGTSWLHEGNADAMAWRAGIELGLYAEPDVWNLRGIALEKCLPEIGEPLNMAGMRGRFELYYSCGAIVDLIAEGAQRSLGLNASAQWRAMFSELTDAEYSQQAYFDSLRALGIDEEVVATIQRLTDEGLDSSEELLGLLDRVGVRVGGLTPERADHALFSALAHVLRQDCPNGYGLHQTADRVAVRGADTCKLLPNEWFNVEAFNGAERSFAAVLAMEAACSESAPVTLTLRDEAGDESELTFPCESPFEYRTLDGWRALD